MSAKLVELNNLWARFTSAVQHWPFPDSLEIAHRLYSDIRDKDYFDAEDAWKNPAEIAALAKAIIGEGTSLLLPGVHVAQTLNLYKDIWQLSEEILHERASPDAPLLGFIRLLYQQMPYQVYSKDSEVGFYRTKKLFRHPAMASTIANFESTIGISLDTFLNTAAWVYEDFKKNVEMTHEDFGKKYLSNPGQAVVEVLSCTRDHFRHCLGLHRATELPYKPYEFNPLLQFPILRASGNWYAPLPELIAYAATRGLYFRFNKTVGFNEAFGRAFQDYVEFILRERLKNDYSVITELEERKLGYQGKTNDLTILLGDVAILIECKTSALLSTGKKKATPDDVLADLRKNLLNKEDLSGIAQLSTKLRALREKSLPGALLARYDGVRKFYPVVLLYDDISFANARHGLRELIEQEMQLHGWRVPLLQIWTVRELENLVRYFQAKDWQQLMNMKFEQEPFCDWDLNVFLHRFIGLPHLRPALYIPRRGPFSQLLREFKDKPKLSNQRDS